MPALLVCLGSFLAAGAAPVPAGMARVPAGEFVPPFRDGAAPQPVQVGAFLLDKRPVTTAEFLDFVRKNPRYVRSRLPRLFADSGYLGSWTGDLEPPVRMLASPATSVSWHAAKQYCSALGKRLPTTAEWERVAATHPGSAAGADEGEHQRIILAWYARSAAAGPPALGTGTRHAHGISDLHGVVWEWTSDFNAWTRSGVNNRGVKEEESLFCGAGAGRALPDTEYATFMRWAFRASLRPDYTVRSLGFRCARDISPSGG